MDASEANGAVLPIGQIMIEPHLDQGMGYSGLSSYQLIMYIGGV